MDIFNEQKFLIRNINCGTYVFYNSTKHFACKIDSPTLMVLNLIYKYRDIDYIVKHIDIKHHDYVLDIYRKVSINKMLELDDQPVPLSDYECIKPSQYYLHLTYECNLGCTYCYNKDVRIHRQTLKLTQWKRIIDKIIAYSERIVLTGGEPFLFSEISELVQYIKEKKVNVQLEIISNCMHNFKSGKYNDTLSLVDSITFSCDSLSKLIDERKNFDSKLFVNNIHYIREQFPNVKVAISSTFIKNSETSLGEIAEFSKDMGCSSRTTLLVPNTIAEFDKVPNVDEYRNMLNRIDKSATLPQKRFSCGAGFGMSSIDPLGNVYPCHNMHYDIFKFGNIVHQSIEDIYSSEKVKTIRHNLHVDNIEQCKMCNIRYICGGGCRGAVYKLYKNEYAYPERLCQYYRAGIASQLDGLKIS